MKQGCLQTPQNYYVFKYLKVDDVHSVNMSRSVSSAIEHVDFVLLRQQQGDIIFIISVMDSRVSESSGQMVLLPVVMPVSVLVGTKSKHTDLKQTSYVTIQSHNKMYKYPYYAWPISGKHYHDHIGNS
ncbi:hypothetical protein ILYODFUR_011077 [Ilyodon furcidens]|uniref:Uncharacterized protein n=1 Tax=Ilyodon furcidens TaxID=33524 RepID=A0ABV0UGI3_9TELE